VKKYLFSCLLLMLPPVLWNLLLASKLPPAFQPEYFNRSVPGFLLYTENSMRFLLFGITALIPLELNTRIQKTGLAIYAGGLLLYAASWLLLIYVAHSGWSLSMAGFSAPAWTPLLWLGGIILMARRFSITLSFSRWYILIPAVLFLLAHITHTLLVYLQLFPPAAQ